MLHQGIAGECQRDGHVIKRHGAALADAVNQPPDRGGDEERRDGVDQHQGVDLRQMDVPLLDQREQGECRENLAAEAFQKCQP